MLQKDVNKTIEKCIMREEKYEVNPRTLEQVIAETCSMPKATRNAWVKRLRSGGYKQGKGYLKRQLGAKKPQFCCLGVLSDQRRDLVFEDRNTWWVDDNTTIWEHRDCDESLPPEGYAGLHINVMDALARANDDGATFKQIAKWIEENL